MGYFTPKLGLTTQKRDNTGEIITQEKGLRSHISSGNLSEICCHLRGSLPEGERGAGGFGSRREWHSDEDLGMSLFAALGTGQEEQPTWVVAQGV